MSDWPERQGRERYALFAGDDYYPRGGWNDLKRLGGTAEVLVEYARTADIKWFHIVDLDTRIIVATGRRDAICRHAQSHRVNDDLAIPGTGILVSGAYMVPGLYCSDCGKRLGD